MRLEPAKCLLRRMALLAWIGEHLDANLGQQQAPAFTIDTLRLAERLL